MGRLCPPRKETDSGAQGVFCLESSTPGSDRVSQGRPAGWVAGGTVEEDGPVTRETPARPRRRGPAGTVGYGSRIAVRRETGRKHATEPYGRARRELCPGGNDTPREDRRRVGSGRGVGGPHRSEEGGERTEWHPDPAEQRRPVSRENFRREPWPRAQTEGPPCHRDF